MLKIGEFSRLSQISIKALHIYDQRGLLRPEHVDRFTGYRYYTLNQLPHAHRIMALKEMGLSLEQIGVMLHQDVSADQMRGMFLLKQAEVEQRVSEEQKRLAMIEFHLRMIELEGNMPDLDVVVKNLEPFKALYIRYDLAPDLIRSTGKEIRQTIAENRIQPVSPRIDIVFGDEINIDDEKVQWASVIPVDDSVTADVELPTMGTLELREMPAATAATILLQGHTTTQGLEKKVLLQRWAVENGYSLCNELRVVQYKGPEHNVPLSELLCEFQVIIEPISEEASHV